MSLHDVHDPSRTADRDRPGQRAGAEGAPGRKGALAGAAVVVACMVACSLPLIAAGGALAGVGAFLAGGWAVALGVVVVVAAIVVGGLVVRRRDAAGGCGCSSRSEG